MLRAHRSAHGLLTSTIEPRKLIRQVSDLTGSFRLYRKSVLVDLVKDCTSKGCAPAACPCISAVVWIHKFSGVSRELALCYLPYFTLSGDGCSRRRLASIHPLLMLRAEVHSHWRATHPQGVLGYIL